MPFNNDDTPSVSLNAREEFDIAVYPTVAQLFLYGIYVSLFGVAISITLARKRRFYKLHIFASTLLFMICTASAIARLILVGLASSEISMSAHLQTSLIIGIHCLANIIADALLIHRCYHIWIPNRYVLYFPILGFFVNIGLGIATLVIPGLYWIFMLVTLVENLYLTAVTAGRIWYINHGSRAILGSKVNTRYNVIAASILESGLLYPLVLIVTSICLALPRLSFHQTLMFNVMLGIQIPIVGIAQSLIIVRIGLGVDDSNTVFNSKELPDSWSAHRQRQCLSYEIRTDRE
ncbi:hypothetical protein BT96DRAFT_434929 [Gymnopus androsaceus JB14]|uniref:G-protein coupled receptors family 1 profile domain-containing protein n=1 Tax=Gymnopus androsaceus JB14 TaxID=1447944 RepID=A0A6A4I4E5_9AGAR|nr:hypothetical protein BT96DRAFT_434929 [Gymnopus androsaceus JB14]